MARNLGTIVGGLFGAAGAYLAARKYEIPLYAALGPASYPLALATGALLGSVVGRDLFKKKKQSD